ncbi:MAG: branched-chain amino acid ABC transporter substrate-binding protein, partial [Alphaproteobacteria bacterium]|nr:branched-chain amino acid ABC transporter substrate-binding protein [Alphaproteobacteria bacterium]
MRRLTGTLVAAAAVLAVTTGLSRAQEIVVGVAGPITGPDAQFGEQMKRGAQKAVDDINAKGGVLGKKLKLVVGDDQCDATQAVAVANKMVSEKVVFMDGHYCSSTSIPASAVYNDGGILQITPASTNPVLTDDAAQKGWNNVFRTVGRDDAQGGVAG